MSDITDIGKADIAKAFRDFGLRMNEVAEALNQFLIQVVNDIEGIDSIDESHGMTIDELIPEAIAEWRQTKEGI